MIAQHATDPLSGPRDTHRPLTYGEKAVGINFNPSQDPAVRTCKQGFAAIIDFLHDLRLHTSSVDAREMYTTAIQAALTSQMWGVKAITWPAARTESERGDTQQEKRYDDAAQQAGVRDLAREEHQKRYG